MRGMHDQTHSARLKYGSGGLLEWAGGPALDGAPRHPRCSTEGLEWASRSNFVRPFVTVRHSSRYAIRGRARYQFISYDFASRVLAAADARRCRCLRKAKIQVRIRTWVRTVRRAHPRAQNARPLLAGSARRSASPSRTEGRGRDQ